MTSHLFQSIWQCAYNCSGQELIEKISEETGFNPKLVSELLEESLPCVSLDDSTSQRFSISSF